MVDFLLRQRGVIMSQETLKLIALGLFVLTYILLLVLSKYRAQVAIVFAIAFVALGILPLEMVVKTVNWNVLMMIAGTMGTVFFFNESKMPARMADAIISRTPNVKWAVICLSVFAGIISAFVDNVATVLMVVPIALSIAKKLDISPVPSVIAIAVASNLEGAATLVGDTTSILLGGYANMNFLDFFIYQGKIGMFFVNQIALAAATLVLVFMFRKDTQGFEVGELTEVTDYFPTFLLLGTVASLIIASFIPNMPELTNGILCIIFFLIGFVKELIIKKDKELIRNVLAEIDFVTLFQLTGLFIIIGGITHIGVVEDISKLFMSISDNVFVIYTVIVWGSVLASAFIDNIPYTATMLPVVTAISVNMGVDPTVLYFGLLAGATLGGNLTPIGASANVTALGILRKEGYDVSAKTFMRISVPYTFAAIFSGYVLVWLLFGI